MLLARLQSHPERGVAIGVNRDTDDSSRHLSLVCVTCGDVGRMRTAIAKGYAEPLRRPHCDVRPELAWWRQHCERQQVCRDGDDSTRGVRPLDELTIVVDRTVARRILHHGTEHSGREVECSVIPDDNLDAQRQSSRPDHVDRLRETLFRDEEGIDRFFPLDGITHVHRLGRGRRFIE